MSDFVQLLSLFKEYNVDISSEADVYDKYTKVYKFSC